MFKKVYIICGNCSGLSAVVPKRIISQGIEGTRRYPSLNGMSMKFLIDVLNNPVNYRFSSISPGPVLLEMVPCDLPGSGR